MSPLLLAICTIWIGVWKGPPYLSVISVGGSMDVSSGRRLVLHDIIVVTYLSCHILIVLLTIFYMPSMLSAGLRSGM